MSWFSDRWGTGGPFGWATKTIQRNAPQIETGLVDTLASGLTGGIPGMVAGGLAGWGNALSGGGGPTLKGTLGAAAGGGLAGAAFGGESPLASAFGAGSGGGAAGATAPSSAGLDAGAYGGAADASSVASDALAHNAPTSLLGRVGGALKDVGRWAAKNPNTIAGVGNAISEAPLNEARARLLRSQAAQGDYDYEQRKRRDIAMQPILQALAGQMQQYAGSHSVAPNPYGGR